MTVPNDAAEPIEALVKCALGASLPDEPVGDDAKRNGPGWLLGLPMPDELGVPGGIFGLSRGRMVDAGLEDAAARTVARWGGAVSTIAKRLGSITDAYAFTDTPRGRKLGLDAFDLSRDARIASAVLEGRLRYLLQTGGQASRNAVGLSALLDPRGWSETAALIEATGVDLGGSGTGVGRSGGVRRFGARTPGAKAWLDQLAAGAVSGLIREYGPVGLPEHLVAYALDQLGHRASMPAAGPASRQRLAADGFKVIAPGASPILTLTARPGGFRK
ncbi:hypothetical protein [Bradyrhizobium guangdongense]